MMSLNTFLTLSCMVLLAVVLVKSEWGVSAGGGRGWGQWGGVPRSWGGPVLLLTAELG